MARSTGALRSILSAPDAIDGSSSSCTDCNCVGSNGQPNSFRWKATQLKNWVDPRYFHLSMQLFNKLFLGFVKSLYVQHHVKYHYSKKLCIQKA